jgi:DNA-binding protein H-NS
MPTPEELKAQIKAIADDAASKITQLTIELEAAKADAKKAAIAEVKKIMADNDLTLEDLGLAKKKTKAKGSNSLKGTKLPPKVVDSTTGKGWSGRGTKPAWVKELEGKQKTASQASLV